MAKSAKVTGQAQAEKAVSPPTAAEIALAQDLARAQAEAGLPGPLVSALAQRHATLPHDTPETAAAGLAAALAEAQVLSTLAELAGQGGDPITTLLRDLAAQNAAGRPDVAGAALEAALAALPSGPSPQRAALNEIAGRQDRIRHAPEATARRLLADLRATPQPAGLFRALHDTWEAWFDRGLAEGLIFDLTVALHLARANADRAKGVQHTQALSDLAITQFRLGEKEARAERLRAAVASFRAVVSALPRKADPDAWAAGVVNLGIALATLGRMENGQANLTEAVKCHRAALQVQTRARLPEDWAATTGHLAEALQALADLTGDPETTRAAAEARAAFGA